MAILLAFLTNLTLTSFISCFILKLNININESIKDMNISKKIYIERVARHKYLFSYHKYSWVILTLSLKLPSINQRKI